MIFLKTFDLLDILLILDNAIYLSIYLQFLIKS